MFQWKQRRYSQWGRIPDILPTEKTSNFRSKYCEGPTSVPTVLRYNGTSINSDRLEYLTSSGSVLSNEKQT